MFKRVIWTGVGYGLGLGTSIYVQRKVRRAVDRAPERVRAEMSQRGRVVAQRARVITSDVRHIVRESREATRGGDPGDQIDLREAAAGPFGRIVRSTRSVA